jgi:hypothetical protein
MQRKTEIPFLRVGNLASSTSRDPRRREAEANAEGI